MIFLAFRYLIARKKQSVLTLLGVALGTAAYITFAAIMTGFQGFIINQLVNNDAHVRITARDEMKSEQQFKELFFADQSHVFWITPPTGRSQAFKIDYPIGWYNRLKADPRVLSFAPQIGAQVVYTKGGLTQGGRLQGIVPDAQSRVTNIENYMKQGLFKSLSLGANNIVIGEGLMKKLGARLNDAILVAPGVGQPKPFKITGVFNFGVTQLDDTHGFANLKDVQSAIGRPSEITDIAIKLVDVDLAQEFALQYSEMTQNQVKSWDQSNANILGVFSLQDFIRSFVTIAIMIVASFGIYNILNILVSQKRKDIGILRSMGYDGNEVQFLFLIQGLVLGVSGGVIGLFFGFFMSLYLSTLHIGGMMESLVVNFSVELYVTGLIMAVASAVVSSYLPARAAGKLRPIDIIRSGE
jgi:lipoprotein-releasing system permease protein